MGLLLMSTRPLNEFGIPWYCISVNTCSYPRSEVHEKSSYQQQEPTTITSSSNLHSNCKMMEKEQYTCKIIFFLKHTVYIIQWRAFQKNIIFIYLYHLSSFFHSWSMVFCLGPPRTMKNRTGRSLLECTSFLPGSTASRRPRGKVFPFPMKRIHGTIVGRFTYHLRDDCVFT